MVKFLRTFVIVTFAALAGAAVSQSSHAAQRGTSAFDGTWSVLLQTTRGNCPAAVRAGVRIFGGRVLAEDQGYEIDGRVAPSGVLQVTVSAAGQGGGAVGRLSHVAGRGRWQTWSGECAGEWTAARHD